MHRGTSCGSRQLIREDTGPFFIDGLAGVTWLGEEA